MLGRRGSCEAVTSEIAVDFEIRFFFFYRVCVNVKTFIGRRNAQKLLAGCLDFRCGRLVVVVFVKLK